MTHVAWRSNLHYLQTTCYSPVLQFIIGDQSVMYRFDTPYNIEGFNKCRWGMVGYRATTLTIPMSLMRPKYKWVCFRTMHLTADTIGIPCEP
jgi:hypothetical protein